MLHCLQYFIAPPLFLFSLSSDIIMISPDRVLQVYTRDHFPSYLGHHGITHTNKNVRERERETERQKERDWEREREREREWERERLKLQCKMLFVFLHVGCFVKNGSCCCHDNQFFLQPYQSVVEVLKQVKRERKRRGRERAKGWREMKKWKLLNVLF